MTVLAMSTTTLHPASRAPRAAIVLGGIAVLEYAMMMPGLAWLAAQHCDVNEALAEMEATVRTYPDASYSSNRHLVARREAYLEALAQLRQSVAR